LLESTKNGDSLQRKIVC